VADGNRRISYTHSLLGCQNNKVVQHDYDIADYIACVFYF